MYKIGGEGDAGGAVCGSNWSGKPSILTVR